jgi:hypothetical protein
MRKTRAAVILLLALSGCASPRSRVETGLVDAGITPAVARCMAGRMTDRLSLIQLRRLAGLPKAPHAHSLDQLLYRLRALDDPEIVRVTSKAALACEVGDLLS